MSFARWSLAAALLGGVLLAGPIGAEEKAAAPAAAPVAMQPNLEPKAVELLQAMSAKLAAAKTMRFKAVATYESPAITGQPLAYTTLSEVTLERPDKLKVVTPGDGPPSEFIYDGKTMLAFAPHEDLVAVADAPPTIDAMLKAAYDGAAIYFPFTDVIVADPYGDIAPELKLAFYIGQSHVVGGTVTDMVAVANDTTQAQIWIGEKDKLPRMIRATYFNEAGNFRHVVELSDWHLDPKLPAGTFGPGKAAKAQHIEFAPPGVVKPKSP